MRNRGLADVAHYSRTVPDPEARSPFVLGGALHRRPERATVISFALLAAVILVPLRGLYKGVGSSMEEGFMLVFPKRMLAGDVPNVDFLHLYGPGSLHVLMGWYSVLSTPFHLLMIGSSMSELIMAMYKSLQMVGRHGHWFPLRYLSDGSQVWLLILWIRIQLL